MKFKSIFFLIMVAIIALSSCDYITNPIPPAPNVSPIPTTVPTDTNSSKKANVYKVLLEDCMGNQCPNCPRAVNVGDSLISPTYTSTAGQIVMVEENMGEFAVPSTTVAGAPYYAFSTDYRCVASTDWCNDFGLFNGPYPAGMINRSGYPSNINLGYPIWADTIGAYLANNQTPSVEITIHDSCWVPQRIIVADFQVTTLKALPAGSYYLVAVVVENPIISWQEDVFAPSGFDSTYVHTNVLRGAFGNNTGGLPNGVQVLNTSVGSTWLSRQTYDFTKGENGNAAGWNMANCSIVAFVYNQTTQRVVQAEMIKIE